MWDGEKNHSSSVITVCQQIIRVAYLASRVAHDAISVLQDGAAGEPRIRDPSEAAVAVEGVAGQVEGLESLPGSSIIISQIP